MGAVSYAHSAAFHETAATDHVRFHALSSCQQREEAELVATLVREVRERHSGETIAILARSRSHLDRILPALREAGIRAQAIEVEQLGHQPVVSDLMALVEGRAQGQSVRKKPAAKHPKSYTAVSTPVAKASHSVAPEKMIPFDGDEAFSDF